MMASRYRWAIALLVLIGVLALGLAATRASGISTNIFLPLISRSYAEPTSSPTLPSGTGISASPSQSAAPPQTRTPTSSATAEIPTAPQSTPTSTVISRLTSTPTPTRSLTRTRTATVRATATPTRAVTRTPTRAATQLVTLTPISTDAVLVGAGDIASCSSTGDESTANLLDQISGTVFTLGDNAYNSGTATEFADCYAPSWGRHKARTYPAPGNHDYVTSSAAGYYSYFGARAGDPAKGYYSYNLGAWHIVVLNSEIAAGVGSAQEQWLRADLAAQPTLCTLAYWHKPRFSSGPHGNNSTFQPFWQALYDHHADVVLSGHDHDYERFAPQTPGGAADPVNGIREFVVGTGGASQYPFLTTRPNSEVRRTGIFGVLKLTLHPASYAWDYIPVEGETFTDSGTATCH